MNLILRPLERKSAEVQAAEALRDHILDGGAQPGTRLTEVKLSTGLSLSRTTVRTALHQLVHEGLVVQLPYTGWMVTSLTSRDAWELHTLRCTLEAMAARLAAEALTAAGAQRLTEALETLIEATGSGDAALVAERDFDLHRVILDLAGHRRLREQYRLVEQQIRLYIASCNALVPEVDSIVVAHRRMVEAILARDVEAAARIAREHNEEDGLMLVELLRRREAEAAS